MAVYTLKNDQIQVELATQPLVLRVHDLKRKRFFDGAESDAGFILNGKETSWDAWNIQTIPRDGEITYLLSLKECRFPVEVIVHYKIMNDKLLGELCVKRDEERIIKTLKWPGQWLLTTRDEETTLFRERVDQLSWKRIKFRREEEFLCLSDNVADPGFLPAIVACFYDGNGGSYLTTSERVLPFTTWMEGSKGKDGRPICMRIGLGEYQVYNRNGARDPWKISLNILSDNNGDGETDICDYFLALNRAMPNPDPIYRDSFWYKIICVEPERGNVTSFKEANEIIASIANVLDRWPQVALLTAWTFKEIKDSPVGMDLMGFGGMESLVEDAGTADEIRDLHHIGSNQHNAVVSYHLNVDDSYREYPGWDSSIICRDPKGAMVPWINMFGRIGFHISHTLDVESGKVFDRLDRFCSYLPLDKVVHLDAFRNTNMHWGKDEFIGMVDELECGVNPIIEYFNRKGVAVSIEGARQMPIQQVGWVSAFWHMSRLTDCPARTVLFHGKAIAGGVPGCPERVSHAFGTSIDTDICYRPSPNPLSLSIKREWNKIVDLLYLGFLFYQFCLRFELLGAYERADYFELNFSEGLKTRVSKDGEWLECRWNELIVAKDDDRMLPFDESLFFYSKEGGDREWLLPENWQKVPIEAVSLDEKGRTPYYLWERKENRIHLRLNPRQPIKFIFRKD